MVGREPATAEDAVYPYQLVLDATAVASEDGFIGLGYLEPYLTNAGVMSVERARPEDPRRDRDRPTPASSRSYVPILPKHVWCIAEEIGLAADADVHE